MLIFVYGENTFLSLRKLSSLRQHFIAKHDPTGMNVAEFDGSKVKIGEGMSAIQAPPFLGAKRMVVVKNLCECYSTKPEAKEWIEAFEKIPESTIVVLWDDVSVKKMDRHAMVRAFVDRDDTYVYSFEELQGASLTAWAATHAKELGLAIDRGLLELVVARVGSNLWQLAGELSKLAAYMNGAPVDRAAVELLVRTNSDDQMFALMDAVSSGQQRQVIALLSSQRQFGTSDQQLFAMLSRQVRLLLSVRDLIDQNGSATKQQVADALSLHPFVAQKTLSQAQRYTKDKLFELQTLLYQLDRSIKAGQADAGLAVDRTVVSMI